MENGFHDFLQHREKRGFYVGKENDGVELPDENSTQINEERDSRHREERYSREDRKVMDEVDFYKDRLYKKIDSCFLRYGLEGLKRIDEGIAFAITKYIDSLKGGTNFEDRYYKNNPSVQENYRRPPERVSYKDEEVQQRAPQTPQKAFKKPVKIEGSNPNPPVQRRGDVKLESPQFNPELLNAILTDVIPPTEIHEVEIKSSIPRPRVTESSAPQKVDFAPVPEEMQDAENYDNGSEQQIPESDQEPGKYDIAKDMLAGVGNTDVDLFVPPEIEEDTPENFTSEEELDAPIVEAETQTPIDMPTPKKRGKKKS